MIAAGFAGEPARPLLHSWAPAPASAPSKLKSIKTLPAGKALMPARHNIPRKTALYAHGKASLVSAAPKRH